MPATDAVPPVRRGRRAARSAGLIAAVVHRMRLPRTLLGLLAGAALALVYAVGGGRGATPARLALAGAALNATLYSYVSAVMLLDTASLERLRFWTVGSLASADAATVTRVLPFILVGLLVALAAARPLNALALGDDAARALGARPALIRAAVIVAVTLLCGAATAACGPIVFVGLLVPHLVRALTGPDLRWLLPYCAVLAPVVVPAARRRATATASERA
ncbi:ABC-type Fe3+-siderophore transport system permease subunit [Micromonospora luteifusca]|uniref:ABC-type Fe3+-siderophore transport system permease subunit n=1 Tax=Micromonospora luteifusca TaxID=709860 RepID=A0ABS2LL70_9ACTN|nr:ABC-type Fe3+-siderophore transport system permease subunit [Micromonospora luteifusca]